MLKNYRNNSSGDIFLHVGQRTRYTPLHAGDDVSVPNFQVRFLFLATLDFRNYAKIYLHWLVVYCCLHLACYIYQNTYTSPQVVVVLARKTRRVNSTKGVDFTTRLLPKLCTHKLMHNVQYTTYVKRMANNLSVTAG